MQWMNLALGKPPSLSWYLHCWVFNIINTFFKILSDVDHFIVLMGFVTIWLLPYTGIRSLNHWTAREMSINEFVKVNYFLNKIHTHKMAQIMNAQFNEFLLHRGSFSSFFPILMPFVSILTRLFSTVLNWYSVGILVLLLIKEENSQSFIIKHGISCGFFCR